MTFPPNILRSWTAAFLAALFLLLWASPSHAQIVRTAKFTRGAVGEYTNNAHQPNNVKTFADLKIASITISQNTANGAWGGTQGNDYAVNVVIAYSDGRAPVSFAAAVNWVKNAGGTSPTRFDWVGLATSGPVADNYPLSAGHQQSYALQYAASLATITTGSKIDGSANRGSAIDSLNENFIAFTNTNATDASGNPSYSFSYYENQASGATLGTVTASAGGTTVTYAITGGNTNGWFAINSSTGAITLTAAGAASLANNFERLANSHSLTVSATNSASSTTAQVVLNELNVVEGPEFTNTNATDGSGNAYYNFSYNENQATGAALASVSATGGTAALSFSITAGNTNGWYAINSSTGAITITAAGAASLANDFETDPNSQTLTVRVTDGTSAATIQVVLNEMDMDESDLAVTKSASADRVAVNGLFEYTIIVSNITLEPGRASRVVVTDQLPAGVTVRSITTSLGSCSQSGSVITCSFDRLVTGASATIIIAVTAPPVAALITNTVSVSANGIDTNSANNSASVQTAVIVPIPLSVTKVSAVYAGSGAGAFAVPGQQMVYTIQVANPSISVNGNTMLIVDSFPAAMEFYNGDFDPAVPGSGPIKFTDGARPSGLTCCTNQDISYSDDPAGTANPVFDYVPQTGFDPNVRFIRINPKGVMNAEAGGLTPSFTLNFRGRIK